MHEYIRPTNEKEEVKLVNGKVNFFFSAVDIILYILMVALKSNTLNNYLLK